MENNLNQQITTIRAMKCCLCQKTLSVGPVMNCSEDGTNLKCGRCKDVPNGKIVSKNLFYENLAKLITFPCIYKNCKKYLKWDQVENHEMVCNYRTVTCPLYFQSCTLDVELSNLQNHFKKSHRGNIQYDSLRYSLPQNYNTVVLLVSKNLMYFVYLFNSLDRPISAIVFAVSHLKKDKKYDVKFCSEADPNIFISYKHQKVVPFNERKHCYTCFSQKCNRKYHVNSVEYKKAENKEITALRSGFKDVQNFFKNCKKLVFTVDIVSEDAQVEEKSTTTDDSVDLLRMHQLTVKENHYNTCNNFLRQSLECPICKEYMLAPIYMCEMGHPVCNACKPQLANCPSCQGPLGDTRCYALERMADGLELPCLYESSGCPFISRLERLREHETVCPHRKE